MSRMTRVRKSWTEADYESYEVLALLGTRRPVATVTRARDGWLPRRLARVLLRSVTRLHIAGGAH